MTSETPPFWFEPPGLRAWALWPFSLVYSKIASLNMDAKPGYLASVPVLCVGNFIVGGAGKTPTALALGKAAKKKKLKPGFLSRGYGGGIAEATLVEPDKHNAHDVGDEPLLLARQAPTVVAADRAKGAQKLIGLGCDFIIMDDGFQTKHIAKDFNLVVVDGKRGIGNGFSLPAGPLRLALHTQLPHANAVVIIGEGDGATSVIRRIALAAKPVFLGTTKVIAPSTWRKKKCFAFAGIADPEKFFTTLESVGAEILAKKSFGDHHYFSEEEIDELMDEAERLDAIAVTTAKDKTRLDTIHFHNKKKARAKKARIEKIEILEIDLVFEEKNAMARIIDETLMRFERRA